MSRLAIVCFLFIAPLSRAVDHAPVFVSGKGGYSTYRIPSLITTQKGTLLAFCEGRVRSRSDTGDIDLVLKRSLDNGKTWQPMQVVWNDGDNTCGNPCPVIERETGAIVLLMTHNLGADNEARIVDGTAKGSRTAWVTRSIDDGVTWSKPVEITADVKQKEWSWYATGPGVGIQLKSGRLVIPCDSKSMKGNTRESHIIYSDDKGKTWKLGGVVGPSCNESQCVELNDGSVMLNMRSYQGNGRRLVAISKDGGVTFAKPAEDAALIEPVCQASILRYPGEKGPILFSNPASNKREKMTVRLSDDDGKTWPKSKLLHEGPAAYSCLSVMGDKRVACLYECGKEMAYEEIRLSTFPLDWLSK